MGIMEELLAYAILFCEGIIVTEDLYQKRLDELFLKNLDDEMLLDLEWETDIIKAVTYIKTNVNYQDINREAFGKALMEKLKEYYDNCADIEEFAGTMYGLWESLPGNIQKEEPFWTLSYADDPLSWGDEKQTRLIYEKMLNYYNENTN